jgi:LacI family transcriptional regulator
VSSPNLSLIASTLGLSKTTVSNSLRGLPGVSAETRARVFAEAARVGYSVDALATELVSRTRRGEEGGKGQTLAYINTFSDPGYMHELPTTRAFYEGARAEAARQGYAVREFTARAPGMTVFRLVRALQAEGIRGVLMGPRWMDEPDLDFDWDNFSCVLVGETAHRHGLHRVCNHQKHTSLLAIQELHKRGYRRIGVRCVSRYEIAHGQGFSLGVQAAKRRLGAEVRIEEWPGEFHDEEGLLRWVKRRRLEVLVNHGGMPPGLTDLRGPDGRPVAFATLDGGGNDYAGVDQRPEQIGRAAAEWLRRLLVAGERGVTPRPRTVLLEGRWRDGASAPTRA